MKLELSKKSGRPETKAPIQVWFVGRVYKMHDFFSNFWMEYRDPIDLMNHPSNMEICLRW